MTKSGGRHDQAPAARSLRKNGGRASSGRPLCRLATGPPVNGCQCVGCGNPSRQRRCTPASVPSEPRSSLRLTRREQTEVGLKRCWRGPKVVASRLCALRASTSAVRQTDRLRGAAQPVVNIQTSEHHIPSRPRLSVRMFGSWGKKRANASSNCAAL